LKDLTELPTLRQFHELSAEHQAKVEAEHGGVEASVEELAAATAPLVSSALAAEPPEDDGLLEELVRGAGEAAPAAPGPLHPGGEQPEQSAGPEAHPAASRIDSGS